MMNKKVLRDKQGLKTVMRNSVVRQGFMVIMRDILKKRREAKGGIKMINKKIVMNEVVSNEEELKVVLRATLYNIYMRYYSISDFICNKYPLIAKTDDAVIKALEVLLDNDSDIDRSIEFIDNISTEFYKINNAVEDMDKYLYRYYMDKCLYRFYPIMHVGLLHVRKALISPIDKDGKIDVSALSFIDRVYADLCHIECRLNIDNEIKIEGSQNE